MAIGSDVTVSPGDQGWQKYLDGIRYEDVPFKERPGWVAAESSGMPFGDRDSEPVTAMRGEGSVERK